jgi:hypothetical protein
MLIFDPGGMTSRDDLGSARLEDLAVAEREQAARQRLLDGGADTLPARPWVSGPQPPSATDLILHLLWRSNAPDRGGPVDAGDVRAALELLPAARAELDQVETSLIFVARAVGLTWGQVAEALGLRSPQAAQQRLDRLAVRASDRPGG